MALAYTWASGTRGVVDAVEAVSAGWTCSINSAGIAPTADSLLATGEALFDKIIDIDIKAPRGSPRWQPRAWSGGGSDRPTSARWPR